MEEGRVVKYGRFEAQLINAIIDKIIPEEQRKEYKIRFIKELKRFSYEPRRKGEPKNKGCIWELEGIIDLDVYNPENFARFIKEGQHLKYLKPTAKRERKSLFKNL